MDWKTCVYASHYLDVQTRFDWPAGGINGFDCEDAFTINDLGGVVSWVWTWPGDYLLSLPAVQSFFVMEPHPVVGSFWSGVFSGLLLSLIVHGFYKWVDK